MRTPSPVRSATFRLSLLAAPLHLAVGLAVAGFIYVNTLSIMERRVDVGLSAERARRLDDLQGLGREATIERIRKLIAAERGSARLYMLTEDDEVLAANFVPSRRWRPVPGAYANADVRRAENEPAIQARFFTLALPHRLKLVLGRDLSEEDQFRLVIEETLGIAVGLTVLLSLAAGIVSSRMVLKRLSGLNGTANRILHGNVRERMPVSGRGDEFDQLAGNLNEALDRIAELMEATRQVTDNIAHDLRGPLSRIRNRLELALVAAEARGKGDDEVLATSLDDIDQVLDTFEALLSIARMEHGVAPEFEPVGLGGLTEDLVDYFQPLAEEKDLDLSLAIDAERVVYADRHLLFQALSNVLDNAVRYTPSGGRIRVSVTTEGDRAVLTVADNGPGIPESQRAEVLKRFVRLDTSRHQPGNGLGLAVVDAVARYHHAKLKLADNHPGLAVSMSLPLFSDSDAGPT